MALRRALPLLLLSGSLFAADLKPLSGNAVTGELLRVNEREVALKTATGDVALPVAKILHLDLQPAPGPFKAATYLDVRLTDDTLLHCAEVTLKEKRAELKLTTGQTTTVPIDALAYVLREAHDEKNRDDWLERFVKPKRTSDLLGIRGPDGRINLLKGTLGDASADGTTIAFDLNSTGTPRAVRLDRAHGLSFLRPAGGSIVPAVCKLLDTSHNLVIVAALRHSKDGFAVTTPAGAELSFPITQVFRLDFSKGKYAYLPDLKIVKIDGPAPEERFGVYSENKNLDNTPIRMKVPNQPAPVTFDAGVCVYAPFEREYELGGEYNEFRAVVGFDEIDEERDVNVGPTTLKVFGDGKEVYAGSFTRRDPPKALAINIKDVQRLRIEVGPKPPEHVRKRLTLAEARVSK